MFIATFKNTLKTLLRSPSFWMVLAIGLAYSIYNEVMACHYGYVNMETYEMIWDTDPRYVLSFQDYCKMLANASKTIAVYSSALVCVVSASVIFLRDYGDRLYEIEKSSGAKPSAYVYGRFASLIAVNTANHFLLIMISVFSYVVTRGGVDGMSLPAAFSDLFVRAFFQELIVGIPSILIYVSVTYLIAALFKSGVAASIGGLLFALFYIVFGKLFVWTGGPIIAFIRENLTPVPHKVFDYMYYFRTEYHQQMIEHFGITTQDVVLSVTAFVLFSALLSAVVYLSTRKRTI